MLTRLASIGVFVALIATATEARVLKSEPPMGALQQGERVLVDDRRCPKGQIREVTGGNHVEAGGVKRIKRDSRCIPR